MKEYDIIAIDGPAASGKSTVARLVARRLGGYFVNTGEMYRAATWFMLQQSSDIGQALRDTRKIVEQMDICYDVEPNGELTLHLNGTPINKGELRTPEITRHVSAVAADGNIRELLVARQRDLARLGLVVVEGRDIGTVVFPETPYKFFLKASPETRARRRLNQDGEETAAEATIQSVAADIARRDHYDASRQIAPLEPASDAHTLTTDNISAEEAAQQIAESVSRSRKEHRHAE